MKKEEKIFSNIKGLTSTTTLKTTAIRTDCGCKLEIQELISLFEVGEFLKRPILAVDHIQRLLNTHKTKIARLSHEECQNCFKEKQKDLIARFNSLFNVGDKVIIKNDLGVPIMVTVDSWAAMLGNTPVCYFKETGNYDLTRVQFEDSILLKKGNNE